MKKFRAVIYILLFFAGIVLLVIFLSNFINSKLDQNKTPVPAANMEQSANTENSTSSATVTTTSTSASEQTLATSDQTSSSATQTAATPATSVSTVGLVNSSSSYYDVTGTVKSKNVISLFPQTSGSIKKVNFQEGDYVNAGETVVELTGNNLTEHPSETQLKIAQSNLANAKNALANVQKSNTESLKTANLQLQSAADQANAIAYDLAAIQQNQTGLQDGIQILQNSLDNTQEKNNRDLIKTQTDIQTLIYTLNTAQNDRAQTMQKIDDLQNQINNLPPAPPANPANPTPAPNLADALNQQLAKLQTALDAQSKGINDLYDAIDKSKYGLQTTENTSQVGVNQILGQIQSSQNQTKVLDLTLNSTKTKLGYTGDSSDALQLAEQAYNSTKVQLATALDNAENQVKIAQLNYDLAQNSAAGLIIKAPFSGLISSLDLSQGQQVNPQTSIAEIINPQAYELEVNIDPDIADRLNITQLADVELAGRTLEVPIKTVAPIVNGTTHLVKVRLTLPPISFKANQTLNAKLPLNTTKIQSGESGNTSTTFLPLDAVIIGTESQFVYINDNGKAKKVEVKLGQISGDQIQILSGLSPNDQVILEGAKDLSDGQTISVK